MRIIAGRHRGRALRAPPGLAVRPTSDRAREALFNMLERGEPPLCGARFLDLFAGTGAAALEALSRGAARAVLVDRDPAALACARANVERLGEAARARLLKLDAARLGRAPEEPFDIAFLDPPYGSGLAAPALEAALQGGWLAPGARVAVELAAREPLAPPAGLAIEDERRYGAARLVFLRALGSERRRAEAGPGRATPYSPASARKASTSS
jgi:16S rRNA (guanine966-N2)-methyltransferase